MRLRFLASWLFALLGLGCDALGIAASPPPAEEGTHRLAAESRGPIAITLGADGQLRTGSMDIPITGAPEPAAEAFVAEHPALFGLDQAGLATEGRGSLERDGTTVVGVGVRYQGVPVYGAEVLVGIRDDAIRYVESAAPGGFELDATPTLDEAGAVAAAGALYAASPLAAAPELVVVDVGALTGGPAGGPSLAYRVAVRAPVPESVFVSAVDGRVLLRATHAHTALRREVRDAGGSADYAEVAEAWPVVADEASGVLVTGTEPLTVDTTAVHRHLGEAYDYFANRLSYDGYDGVGSTHIAAVNFSTEVFGPSPAWVGADPPEPDEEILIGPPAFFFPPGTADPDLIRHEYTHAVLDYVGFGTPVYAGISGAVEEGLADAFAAFASDGSRRWELGEGLSDGPVRNLAEPADGSLREPQVDHLEDLDLRTGSACDPDGGCPDEYACREGTCYCLIGDAFCDHGNLHRNSGILGHALYLAAEGGQHSTRPAATLVGIGVPKVQRILFRSLIFLGPRETFRSVRESMVVACQAMAEELEVVPGEGSVRHEDCGRIIEAFAAVGVGPGDRDLDSVNDLVDNCPTNPNPDQAIVDACITNPLIFCQRFEYQRAYELFLQGTDLGPDTSRSSGDALIITARCALSNQDYPVAEAYAVQAAGSSGGGGKADAYFIAEFAAERRWARGRAEDFRMSGLAAAEDAGQCRGLTEMELAGCVDLYRTTTRLGLESL